MWVAVISVLLVLLQVSLGTMMIATASVAANRQINACDRGLAITLRAIGRSCIALGVWGLLAVPATAILLFYRGVLDPSLSAICLISMIYSALILAGGRLQSRVATQLLAPPAIEEQRRSEWRISLLRAVGWTLAMMPVGMPLGLLVGFYFLIVAIVGAGTRVQQESLLLILAIAMRTQAPLAEEVDSLADSSRGRFRKRLRVLADKLRQGFRLSESLEGVPGLVPSRSVTAIRVGEELGNVAAAVGDEAMRVRLQQENRLQGRLSAAGLLFYFCCSLYVMFGIVSFLMYWIIPKFKKIFQDFGAELPGPTVAVIVVANYVVDYAPVVLFCAAVVFAIPLFKLIRRGGFAALDGSLISAVYPRLETPGVLRNLAQAVAVRRPLADAVSGMESHHRRRHVRKRMRRVRDEVARGRDCFEPLHHSGLLNASEAAALTSAERAGNLAWALHSVADGIDRRHRALLQGLAETIQPACVMLLGFLILFVCVGFFMPLVKLINSPTVSWY